MYRCLLKCSHLYSSEIWEKSFSREVCVADVLLAIVCYKKMTLKRNSAVTVQWICVVNLISKLCFLLNEVRTIFKERKKENKVVVMIWPTRFPNFAHLSLMRNSCRLLSTQTKKNQIYDRRIKAKPYGFQFLIIRGEHFELFLRC